MKKQSHTLKAIVSFLAMMFMLTGGSAIAQSWTDVGAAGFTEAGHGVSATSIAINGSGTPYMVYQDGAYGGSATVVMYNGSSWVTVGSAGFSTLGGEYQIAIDASGTPYVVYRDALSGGNIGATVMKYNGSSWVIVGSARFSAGQANQPSIAINSSGTPYVAYQDEANSNKATVMMYNGSSWVTVGSAGFSAGQAEYPSIAINSSGTPYVVYYDGGNGGKATVMDYNGSSWVDVGSAGFSAGVAYYTSIAINSSGTPYVVYEDAGNRDKATVKMYTGSSWVTVGSAGFSAGAVYYTSIAINSSGAPYVVYTDSVNSDKATVMKYSGSSWAAVGSEGFSAGAVSQPSIAINSSGTPYVAYTDESNSDRATVMDFTCLAPTVPTVSTSATIICDGDPTTCSITTGSLNGATNWQWYVEGCGGVHVGTGSSVTFHPSQNTIYYVRGEGGCITAPGSCGASVTVTVQALPGGLFSDPGSAVCVGSSISYSPAPDGQGGSGTWSTSDATVAGVDDDGNVYGLQAGIATVSYTYTTSSCGSSTVSAPVEVDDVPSVTVNPVSAICQGGTTAALGGAFGGSATSATWDDGGAGGTFSSDNTTGLTPNLTTYTASAGSSSPVTLTLTTGGGSCGATSASTSLVVNPNPVAGTITNGAQSVCAGAETATPYSDATAANGTGSWSSDNTSAAVVDDGGNVYGEAYGTANIIYTVTSSVGCGSVSTSSPVTVNAIPTVGVSDVAAICQGATTAALGGSFGGGAAAATWSDGGAGGTFSSDNLTGLTPDVTTYTASATYTSPVTLTLTTAGGSCGSTSTTTSLVVNATAAITSATSAATPICYSATTTITANGVSGAGATLTWWTGAGGTGTNLGSSNPLTVGPGIYYADVTGACGATVEASVTAAFAHIWTDVGSVGFSAGTADPSMAISPGGIPYVVYLDAGNSNKATVMMYNGSSWVTVGSAGFSAGSAAYTSIAISPGGTPYVVYVDGGHGNRATVMMYNGSSWVTVGSAGFSREGSGDDGIYAAYTSIAINSAGTPYVVYQDNTGGFAPGGLSGNATVMEYNGSSWVTVGSPLFSAGVASNTTIAINSSGTPYVAYQDDANGNKATVMEYTGSSWVTVGSAGFSAGGANYPSIAINSSGTPYVVYNDAANSNKATVMEYTGGSWVTVGSAGFSAGAAAYTTIAINSSGTPYVAYQDGGNGTKATVMEYTGSSWVTVGSAGFSAGEAIHTAMAINNSGTPYVAYRDAANGNKATVMDFAPVAPIAFTSAIGEIDATCYGYSNGAISTSVSGGNGTYYYTWTPSVPGTGGANPADVAQGTYSVSVTDGNDCSPAVGLITVNQPAAIMVYSISETDATCYGYSNGTISTSVSGGNGTYYYTWTPSAGTGGANPTGVAQGTYSVSVTDGNSCPAGTNSIMVNQPAAIAVSVNPVSAICQGGTTAALGGSFGGSATSATWDDGGAGGTFSSDNTTGLTPGSTTYTASASSGSSVTLTLTTSGGSCGATSASTTLVVNANPTVSVGAVPPICREATTGALGGSFGGGATSATWDDGGAGGYFTPDNATGLTPGLTRYTNLGSGSPVTLTLTTSGGSCGTASASITLTINPSPVNTYTVTGGGVYCGLYADIGLSGSEVGVSYQLRTATHSPFIFSPVAGTGSAIDFGMQEAEYSYQVTARNVVTGCSASMENTASIYIYTPLNIYSVTGGGSYCSGGAGVDVGLANSDAGISYQLMNGSTNAGSAIVSTGGALDFGNQAGAGTYTVVATNTTTSCTSTMAGSAMVAINPNPTVSVNPVSAVCQGGTTAALGGSFGGGAAAATWSDGGAGGTFSSDNTTGLTPGLTTYMASAGSSSPVTLTLTTSGGYCGTTSATTSLVVNTTVAITSATAASGSVCPGITTCITAGGVSGTGTSLTWYTGPGATGTNLGTANPLTVGAGTYYAYVTGTCGAPVQASVTVSVSALPAVHISSSNNLTCTATSATLTASGAATYTWAGSSSTSSTRTITAAGTYTVTGTGSDGCHASATYTETLTTTPLATPTVTVTNYCGSSILTATGIVSGATVAWSPSGSGNPLTVTAAGSYRATQSLAGCTSAASAAVTATPGTGLTLTPTITNVSCHGGSNGSISVAVSGGTGTISYSWGAPCSGSSSSITGKAAGTYTVTVTQGACHATGAYTITQPAAALSVTGTVTNVTCNGGDNGSVTTTVSGGTPSYSYLWSPGGATASSLTGKAAGTYNVTVTDAHGCTASGSFAIAQPAAMSCAITVTPGTSVYTGGIPTNIYLGYGPQTATLTATATGGSGYSYSWSSTSGTSHLSSTHVANPVFTATLAGSYTFVVTITGETGCTTTCSVTICVVDAVDHSHTGNVLVCHGYGCTPATLSCTSGSVPAYITSHYCPSNHLGAVGSGCTSSGGRESGENDETPVIINDLTVNAYPNPFSTALNVNLQSNQPDKVDVTVYDVTSRVVETVTGQAPGSVITMCENVTPGIYIIEVRQGEEVRKLKVVKY